MSKRVLAGMRASGRLHLGNYYGGAKGMLTLQEDENYDTFYMVANLHGITTPFKPDELKTSARSVIIDYLAAGLDPEESTLFIQSDVADLHAQLAFYLSSVVTVARMQHLPTFKEKVKQYPENVTMALLNYPVLMSADILLYKAHAVPVGIDQEPHLEVSREIARKMNDQYGMDFPEPKRFTIKGGEYIPSLTGEGKMSKSVEGSYILLTDDIDTIKSRLSKVPTDGGKGDIKDGLYFSAEAMKAADSPDVRFTTILVSSNLVDAVASNEKINLLPFVIFFVVTCRIGEYSEFSETDSLLSLFSCLSKSFQLVCGYTLARFSKTKKLSQ